MKQKTILFFGLLVLFFLPGFRYVRWVKEAFDQGCKIPSHTKIAEQYIRSARVYDQLSTLGIFDVLWLSDEVRTAYGCLHAQMNGFSEQKRTVFLRRQREENHHAISFYMLMTAGSKWGNYSRADCEREWGISLCVDGVLYRMKDKKQRDLPIEYVSFFGRYYNKRKNSYIVTFDAVDHTDNLIIHHGVRKIELIFTRYDRKAVLTWCLDDHGHVIKTNITHPNILMYDIK